MSQTVNNENDYRLTRSKTSTSSESLLQQPHGYSHGTSGHGHGQGHGHDTTGVGVMVVDTHKQIPSLTVTAANAAAAQQKGLRRPLGGDVQPLQQRNTRSQAPQAQAPPQGATTTAPPAPPPHGNNVLDIKNPGAPARIGSTRNSQAALVLNSNNNNNNNASKTNKTIFDNIHNPASLNQSSNSTGIVVPRLPQKRQATESSTNLVEKLHISNDSNKGTTSSSNDVNTTTYKKLKHNVSDYEWEDLDEEDLDDPLMVSEYVNDIFYYLRELEVKSLPDSQYLFKQKQLKPKMRLILVDWLVEMHLRFRLLPETLFLAINIMDRFMSVEVVQIDKLQLLATGSLFIAAKYEEVFSPLVKNYAYFTDGSYTEEEILQAEKYILTVLNFDLSYPNPMNFLRRISKADDYDVQLRTLGKYLLEISIIDYKFIGMLPSLCSASAMYIARLILGKSPVWLGNLIHYSGGYRVSDMKHCIEQIIAFLVAPVEHDEFFKKYASRKFMKASILCRSWAKKAIQEQKNIFEE